MTRGRAVYWLLQVDAPHMCAAAVWRRDAAGWRCVDAAPILSWMLDMDVEKVKTYLEKKKAQSGWAWSWIKEDPPR